MLAIRPPSADGANEHPGMLLRRDLLACHGHIRRFSAMAGRLAAAHDVTAAELAGAATAMVDYFERALPLHVSDEEDSLRPRLLSLREDETLARAVECMHAEHPAIEALLADALPRWRRLVPVTSAPGAATIAALEAQRGELHELAEALDDGFTRHLAGEELLVFPALQRLSIEELVAIRFEMRQRRVASAEARRTPP